MESLAAGRRYRAPSALRQQARRRTRERLRQVARSGAAPRPEKAPGALEALWRGEIERGGP